MNPKKLNRLVAAGWQAGTAKEFLKLTDAEAAMVENLTHQAAKGSRKDFEKFLRKVPNVPPLPGDERE